MSVTRPFRGKNVLGSELVGRVLRETGREVGSSLMMFSGDAQAAIPLPLWPKDQGFGCIELVACVAV